MYFFIAMLVVGLVGSQVAGSLMNHDLYHTWEEIVKIGTAWCLSFIMIFVGYEFTIDKSNLAQYSTDAVVAIFCSVVPWGITGAWFILIEWQAGRDIKVPDLLLLAVFAGTCGTGILFTMLEAAGLKQTWVYRKARPLAIFDDLTAITLLVALQIAVNGNFKWQLLTALGVDVLLCVVAAWKMHEVKVPNSWQWTMVYSTVLTAICTFTEFATEHWTPTEMDPIEFEVLLPAFAIGILVWTPHAEQELKQQKLEKEIQRLAQEHPAQVPSDLVASAQQNYPSTTSSLTRYGLPRPGSVAEDEAKDGEAQEDGRKDNPAPRLSAIPGSARTTAANRLSAATRAVHAVDGHDHAETEELVQTSVVGFFMILVGLSIPALFGENADADQLGDLNIEQIVYHCVVVTILMTLGKCVPVLCYQSEATWQQRLALSMGMCPRGEVGASAIVISLNAGISGPVVIVAIICLAVNLIMCGVYVGIATRLLKDEIALPLTQPLTSDATHEAAHDSSHPASHE